MPDMQNESGESEKPEQLGVTNKPGSSAAARLPAGHRFTHAIRLSPHSTGRDA
ncbi:hypothetical protein [Thiobacillus sp. 65-1402]|uniref:hypothetical protein n=1 Tax=Thiobacillus sp. 65-1402 TaxID=1895861 RepID=UPI0025CD0693|nr:hypothetical protein [Thiobacillus sp. 65-1402]